WTWPISTRTSAGSSASGSASSGGSPERLDVLSRGERARDALVRDALVQRLLEAMTAVARLRTQHAELAGETEPTLVGLTRDLQAEAALQAAAAREIETLLAR
ncbi:MAG: hypothetical protein ABIY46_18260, partial [Gemmatimonadales bacterium]